VRILISAASGLIGSALTHALETAGHDLIRLLRPESQAGDQELRKIEWQPMAAIPPDLVSGFDAVIHLSGENIAGRWTERKKILIRDSRIESTQNLAKALAAAEKPPTTFICASAIGYYGSRGDEILTEESSFGKGFFPELCRQWESATQPAFHAGIRTVNLRMGIVLSRQGGALQQMLLPFRLGLGGRIGSGEQWWSWIHINDLVSCVLQILKKPDLRGPVNLTSPNPVTNSEFTQAFATALHRWAILPVPAVVARLLLGELANEGLLASARVFPRKLVESGLQFRYPHLRAAIRSLVE